MIAIRTFLLFLLLLLNLASSAQYAKIELKIRARKGYKKELRTDYGNVIKFYKGHDRYSDEICYRFVDGLPGVHYFDSFTVGHVELVIKSDRRPELMIDSIHLFPDSIIKLSVVYPPYCPYDRRNKKCPFCHKRRGVIPIYYGYPLSLDEQSAWYKKHYLGGCRITGCDPHWYCKRDNRTF